VTDLTRGTVISLGRVKDVQAAALAGNAKWAAILAPSETDRTMDLTVWNLSLKEPKTVLHTDWWADVGADGQTHTTFQIHDISPNGLWVLVRRTVRFGSMEPTITENVINTSTRDVYTLRAERTSIEDPPILRDSSSVRFSDDGRLVWMLNLRSGGQSMIEAWAVDAFSRQAHSFGPDEVIELPLLGNVAAADLTGGGLKLVLRDGRVSRYRLSPSATFSGFPNPLVPGAKAATFGPSEDAPVCKDVVPEVGGTFERRLVEGLCIGFGWQAVEGRSRYFLFAGLENGKFADAPHWLPRDQTLLFSGDGLTVIGLKPTALSVFSTLAILSSTISSSPEPTVDITMSLGRGSADRLKAGWFAEMAKHGSLRVERGRVVLNWPNETKLELGTRDGYMHVWTPGREDEYNTKNEYALPDVDLELTDHVTFDQKLQYAAFATHIPFGRERMPTESTDNIQVFDLRSGVLILGVRRDALVGVRSMAFSPDSSELLILWSDGTFERRLILAPWVATSKWIHRLGEVSTGRRLTTSGTPAAIPPTEYRQIRSTLLSELAAAASVDANAAAMLRHFDSRW